MQKHTKYNEPMGKANTEANGHVNPFPFSYVLALDLACFNTIRAPKRSNLLHDTGVLI